MRYIFIYLFAYHFLFFVFFFFFFFFFLYNRIWVELWQEEFYRCQNRKEIWRWWTNLQSGTTLTNDRLYHICGCHDKCWSWTKTFSRHQIRLHSRCLFVLCYIYWQEKLLFLKVLISAYNLQFSLNDFYHSGF